MIAAKRSAAELLLRPAAGPSLDASVRAPIDRRGLVEIHGIESPSSKLAPGSTSPSPEPAPPTESAPRSSVSSVGNAAARRLHFELAACRLTVVGDRPGVGESRHDHLLHPSIDFDDPISSSFRVGRRRRSTSGTAQSLGGAQLLHRRAASAIFRSDDQFDGAPNLPRRDVEVSTGAAASQEWRGVPRPMQRALPPRSSRGRRVPSDQNPSASPPRRIFAFTAALWSTRPRAAPDAARRRPDGFRGPRSRVPRTP